MTRTATAKTFTSREVCALAQMSYRRLDYAVRYGVLHPDRAVDPEPGWPDGWSGNPRIWSEAEAIKAVELARMLRAGLTYVKATELLAAGLTAAVLKTPLPEILP